MNSIFVEGAPPRVRAIRLTPASLCMAALNVSFVLVVLGAILWGFLIIRWAFDANIVGFDFEGTLWDPAVEIRQGRSPYPAPVTAEVDVGNPALYPPLLMLIVAPLTVLPWWLGVSLWTVLLAAAAASTLYILNVRDVRCYVVALVSMPVVVGLAFGNATLLLVPLIACAWRWRKRWVLTGVLVGLAVVSKLFLWPLLVWLLATRRYRSFAVALASVAAGVLGPWALIGFDGIMTYPDLLQLAEEIYATHSYSVATIFSALGADPHVAGRGALGIGVGIAAVAFYAGRQRADSTSLSLAVLAAIIGSPIVWPFYHALLLVPIAIARPRFSGLWVGVLLFYFANELPRDTLRASDMLPGGAACCRPDEFPAALWAFNHSPPGLWPAAGFAAVAIGLVAVSFVTMRRVRTAL